MILKKDAENMFEIMERTADRADIWQDRFIYWIAVAIYHIILHLNRLERTKMSIYDETRNCDICGEPHVIADMKPVFTGRRKYICIKCVKQGNADVSVRINKMKNRKLRREE